MFTLIIIVTGSIFYSLALRWFKVEFRKLALAEAIERRRALKEAAANEEDESDELISVDEDVQELDLVSVGEQTRYLLRLLFGMGIAAAVLSIMVQHTAPDPVPGYDSNTADRGFLASCLSESDADCGRHLADHEKPARHVGTHCVADDVD